MRLITIMIILSLSSCSYYKTDVVRTLNCLSPNDLKDTSIYECTDTALLHHFTWKDSILKFCTIVLHRDTFKGQALNVVCTAPKDFNDYVANMSTLLGIRMRNNNGKITYEEYFGGTGNPYVNYPEFEVVKTKGNIFFMVVMYTLGARVDDSENLEIFAFVNKRYMRVLYIDEYRADNKDYIEDKASSKLYKYDTNIKILDDNTPFPKIIAMKIGTDMNYRSGKITTINEKNVYIYDRVKQEYELSK